MSRDDEPTAALTSRSAVVAALLLLGAVVVMAIAVGLEGADPGDTEAATEPPVETGFVTTGVTAPDFTLTSLDGETVSLGDYAGRPVLLNFWASWCPPCRAEFPALADAREAHAGDGLEILGVTRNDGVEQSRRFAADSGAEWPILPDSDGAVWEAYGGVGLPTSYFIDAEGVVQRVHIGPVNESQIADHLAAIGIPSQASSEGSPAAG